MLEHLHSYLELWLGDCVIKHYLINFDRLRSITFADIHSWNHSILIDEGMLSKTKVL